ncbi:MAG: LysR substrate-binding domain-containing protein [Luteibacter sp.]
MRKIDHLNALRAFEAAARRQSFVAAAEELSVTPAAVGQLVRNLEGALKITLFHRSTAGPSRLVLTDTARAALPKVEMGLACLAEALQTLRGGDRVVKVTLPPAFADKWLLPRLHRFQARHPDIQLQLETDGRLADYRADGVDVGIRYGRGSWHGMKAERLLTDDFFPVCSPALVEGGLASLADLHRYPLLHDVSMQGEARFPTWATWLRDAGSDDVDPTRGTRINDSAAVIQATMAGAGVALGRTSLVEGDLAAGRLVRPFGPAQTPELAYYVVELESETRTAGVDEFLRWLRMEAEPTPSPAINPTVSSLPPDP